MSIHLVNKSKNHGFYTVVFDIVRLSISRVLYLQVGADHLSSPPIAQWLKRILWLTQAGNLYWINLLAADRVYLPAMSP